MNPELLLKLTISFTAIVSIVFVVLLIVRRILSRDNVRRVRMLEREIMELNSLTGELLQRVGIEVQRRVSNEPVPDDTPAHAKIRGKARELFVSELRELSIGVQRAILKNEEIERSIFNIMRRLEGLPLDRLEVDEMLGSTTDSMRSSIERLRYVYEKISIFAKYI